MVLLNVSAKVKERYILSNYDLSIFSPDEFELLCKDLFEAERGMKLENFKAGKDGGIDLRYADEKKGDLIIQCKRYNDFNSLKNNLKKEVEKVRKLSPRRYILMTSAGLSPSNKDYIKNLFNGYIKEVSDIIGGDEIKELISNNKDIERKHYKLWLTSTNTIQSIINNNILTRSNFTASQIKEKVSIYVHNESLIEALSVLEKDGFLILSGNPGVGKTTLADILSYNFIAEGYDFYEVSEDIEEAEKVFLENSKQIFYYDDFLGRNFLENNLSKNEDKRLLQFINKIVLTKNKKFILTTREYILRQAQHKHDLLQDKKFNVNKYIVNVESYNKKIKAKILYNHLYYSDMPHKYVEKLVEERYYHKIIDHQNYNPRIISLMTTKLMVEEHAVEEYPNKFLHKMSYPQDIWEFVYENHISESSQYILLLVMTIGENVSIKSLEKFFNELNIHLQMKFENRAFKKGIRELEKTFISIKKNDYILNRNQSKDELFISFQNPSIRDFLITYTSQDATVIEIIWNSSIYLKPLLKTFSLKEERGKVIIPQRLGEKVSNLIIENFYEFEDTKSVGNNFERIVELTKFVDVDKYKKLKVFFIEEFKEINNFQSLDKQTYLTLLNNYKKLLVSEINFERVLTNIIEDTYFPEDLNNIKFIKEKFSDDFEKIFDLENIEGLIKSVNDNFINDADYHEKYILEDVVEIYENLAEELDINLDEYIDSIYEEMTNAIDENEPDDEYKEEYENYLSRSDLEREVEDIDDLFNSLLEESEL